MNHILSNTADNGCQDNSSKNFVDSEWRQGIDALAGEFLEAQKSRSERTRGLFYERFWKMSVSAAKSVLRSRGWRGDMHQDGLDVASANVAILLQQEERGKGVFGARPRTEDEIRGYLSRTIWLGCKQRIGRVMKKQMESLDALIEAGMDLGLLHDQCVSDPVLRMDLKVALENLQQDQRGHYRKLPAGVTPLDCVMDVGVGKALLKGVKMRTLQRYTKQIREDVARQVGVDLEARRKAAQRGVENRRRAKAQRGLVGGIGI